MTTREPRKQRLRHPRQPPPRLPVAEAQLAVIASAAGVDRPVLRHHRQVATAGRGQADALVGKQLRPSRARRLLLVQHGAESELSMIALAAGKELAVLGHGDGEVAPHAAIALALTPWMLAVRSDPRQAFRKHSASGERS